MSGLRTTRAGSPRLGARASVAVFVLLAAFSPLVAADNDACQRCYDTLDAQLKLALAKFEACRTAAVNAARTATAAYVGALLGAAATYNPTVILATTTGGLGVQQSVVQGAAATEADCAATFLAETNAAIAQYQQCAAEHCKQREKLTAVVPLARGCDAIDTLTVTGVRGEKNWTFAVHHQPVAFGGLLVCLNFEGTGVYEGELNVSEGGCLPARQPILSYPATLCLNPIPTPVVPTFAWVSICQQWCFGGEAVATRVPLEE